MHSSFSFLSLETSAPEINKYMKYSFPVAQLVEHGTSNAKIMGLIPRESKSW